MKKKKYIIAVIIVFFIIVLLLFGKPLYYLMFDQKNVTPKMYCSPSKDNLVKVGKVSNVDMYTYCIEKIKFRHGKYFTDKEDFLSGNFYYTKVWDGGTEIYIGKNYYVIDCQELGGKHLKYIISNINNEQDALRYCHLKEDEK